MTVDRQGRVIGAVIPAAGLGERMQGFPHPKPLVRVAGISLLERTYRTLRLGGVNSTIVVVVGHRGDEIEAFVRERGLDVKLIHNPHYARGNGTSVLSALPHLPETFVVAMADHIHTPASVRALLRCKGEFVAGIDATPAFADREEATRVRLRGNCAVEFEKGIAPYDALDNGLFVCSRSALEQVVVSTDRDLSWNEFKRIWLESGREIAACDMSHAPWIDVDSPRELHRGLDVILAWAASGNDGFVSRHLNRKVSRRITRLLLRTPITANQASVLSFGVAAMGEGALMRGSWRLGGGLIQLSSILDGCDGEIARARLESSPAGGVFDATLDRWADALIVSGMAMGAGDRRASWAGYPALTGVLLVPYTRAKLEAELGRTPRGLTRLGATRDVRLSLLCLGALLRRPLVTLTVIAVASNAEVARRLLALGRVRG